MNSRHFAALLLAASFGLGTSASAGPPPTATGEPDFSVEFPAGWACSNFGVKIDIWEGGAVVRQVKDRNGVVRALLAGTGNTFRYTNMLTGKTTSTRAGGASQISTSYAVDGTQKVTTNGHVLVVWFPSDIPAGPSTNYYTGRFVYTLSPDYVGTMQSHSGNSRDICTELS